MVRAHAHALVDEQFNRVAADQAEQLARMRVELASDDDEAAPTARPH